MYYIYWKKKNPHVSAAAAAKSLESCPTLCDAIDGSPPGSSVPGVFQGGILEWVAISFSKACMHAKLLQSCPTLCDPMDRLLCSRDPLGKNTGVGCHFLLQHISGPMQFRSMMFKGQLYKPAYPACTPKCLLIWLSHSSLIFPWT